MDLWIADVLTLRASMTRLIFIFNAQCVCCCVRCFLALDGHHDRCCLCSL